MRDKLFLALLVLLNVRIYAYDLTNALKLKKRFFEIEKNRLWNKRYYENHTEGEYNILNINMELVIDPDTADAVIKGEYKIRSNKNDLESITFKMPQFKVSAVYDENDNNLDFSMSTNSNLLTIYLNSPKFKDDEFTVKLTISGIIACGKGNLVMSCDFDSEPKYITYESFYPQTVYTVDPFTYFLKVTVPDKWTVASPAVLLKSETGKLNTKIFTFENSVETELIPLAFGDFDVSENNTLGFPLRYYHIKSHDYLDNAILQKGVEIVNFYQQIFSPFPWKKLDIIEIANSFGGGFGPMGAIMVIKNVFEIPLDSPVGFVLFQLLAHEIGHQWWGNYIGVYSPDSIILSEGMAEFSSSQFSDLLLPERFHIVSNGLAYMFQVPYSEDVSITAMQVYISKYYVPIMYDKGSFIIDMLKVELGDNLFFKGIKKFLSDFGMKYATINDFIETFKKVSNKDINYFFDTWFFKKGFPELVVEVENSSKELVLRFTQKKDELYRFTLPISIYYDNGEKEIKKFFVDKKVSEIHIQKPEKKKIVAVIPDEKRNILCKFEFKDPVDFNLDGKIDGIDALLLARGFGRSILHGGQGMLMPDPYFKEYFDLNKDLVIDSNDLEMFQESFKK